MPYQKTWTQDDISKELASMTAVDDLSKDPSQKFMFRGRCIKCGWQTLQMSEADAAALVQNHAQRHLVGN